MTEYTPRKTPTQRKSFVPKQTVDFLRSVETCTLGFDFMPEEGLDKLPDGVAERIMEMEDLLCTLSLQATAVLFDLGHMPFIAARGRK
jgi:hypothetical protein